MKNYSIIIAPTENCNLRCSYCYQNHASYQAPIDEYPEILEFIRDNLIIPNKFNKVIIILTGGEITIYKHLKELCSYIKKIFINFDLRVNFLTNGIKTDIFYDLKPILKENMNNLIVSYHKEQIKDSKKWLENILNVRKLFRKNTINIMLENDLDLSLFDIKELTDVRYKDISNYTLKKYYDVKINKVHYRPTEIIDNFQKFTGGVKCSAINYTIYISPKLEISKCLNNIQSTNLGTFEKCKDILLKTQKMGFTICSSKCEPCIKVKKSKL